MTHDPTRPHWADPDILADIDRFIGWTDRGEANALAVVASDCRGQPVLDVGVGSGRTTAYLRLLTDDYVGIDYTPAMVERARHRHPDRELRVGDARDLSAWPDASFALVMFSFNGIDAVDRAGRGRVLDEFVRVVRPGGYLLYSTLNKDGPAYREPPWHHYGRLNAGKPRWLRVVKTAVLFPRRLQELRASYRAWWRARRYAEDHGEWGIAALAVYDYRLVVHFQTLDASLAELTGRGMQVVAVFGNDGRPVAPGDDVSDLDYFHLVARKPPSRGSVRDDR